MFESDVALTGKHASFLKFLAVKNSQDSDDEETVNSAKLFERYIDVYMNAAIWGLLYSRTARRDALTKSRARVYAAQFNAERENCVFLYRMVMLLDRTTELTPEERVDRAFRYDTQPEKVEEFRQNMELFHDYVRGGIEVMYEQFTDGCQTQDDYLSKT
ncbi:MAG: hypothetical protein RSG53_09350, partial [Oscillospiraceae bacterium]